MTAAMPLAIASPMMSPNAPWSLLLFFACPHLRPCPASWRWRNIRPAPWSASKATRARAQASFSLRHYVPIDDYKALSAFGKATTTAFIRHPAAGLHDYKAQTPNRRFHGTQYKAPATRGGFVVSGLLRNLGFYYSPNEIRNGKKD